MSCDLQFTLPTFLGPCKVNGVKAYAVFIYIGGARMIYFDSGFTLWAGALWDSNMDPKCNKLDLAHTPIETHLKQKSLVG